MWEGNAGRMLVDILRIELSVDVSMKLLLNCVVVMRTTAGKGSPLSVRAERCWRKDIPLCPILRAGIRPLMLMQASPMALWSRSQTFSDGSRS